MARRGVRYIVMLILLMGCLAPVRLAHASGIELIAGGVSLSHRYTPILAEGGFAVPIQLAAELGAEVSEVGERHVIRYLGKEAWVRSGVNKVETAAAVKELAIAPVSLEGELYIPLRFLADIMRLRVSWDASRRVLTLSEWSTLSSLTGLGMGPTGPATEVMGSAASTPAELPPSQVEPTESASEVGGPMATLAGLVQSAGEAYLVPLGANSVVPVPLPFAAPRFPQETQVGMWREVFADTGIRVTYRQQAGVERYTFKATKGTLQVESALIVEPYRLLVDFYGVQGREYKPLAVETDLVEQIRARPEGDHLRMVFDLRVGVGHRVEQTSADQVTLLLQRPLSEILVDANERGGQIIFDVDGRTPHDVMHLHDPERVVIDLPSTTLIGGAIQIGVPQGPVSTVRAAQFNPDVTRVVLDLREATPLNAREGSSQLVLDYGEPDSLLAYRKINERELQIGLLVDPERTLSVKQLTGPDRIAIDIPDTVLEAPVPEAFIEAGPVYRLRTSQFDKETVRIVADLRYYVQHRIYRDGDRTVVALQQPTLGGSRVAIDAGHGGHDPGAISQTLSMTESVLNMDVARRVQQLVEGADGTVRMTRADDRYVDLWGRADLANEFPADIFVSVHHNASHAEGPTASGTETYVQVGEADSFRLGQAVHQSLISAVGTRDRGVRPNPGYIVLNRAKMPAILVEVAFVTNAEDEELLEQEWFRQRAAEGIFNGILKYFHPSPEESGTDRAVDSAATKAKWTPLGAHSAAL